jgi:hypothetical protein
MPRFSPPADTENTDGPVIEIASALGEVYFIRKEAEDEQKTLREEFFAAVTASYEGQDLAQKQVEIPIDIATRDDAEEYARQYHPGWRVVDFSDDERTFVMEEDPVFKQHTQVVELDPWEIPAPTKANPDRTKTVYGYVITKTVRSGSTLVDDQRMMSRRSRVV